MRIVEIVATEWIEQAWDLLEAHHEELTTNKDLMVLALNVDVYQALEDAGKLVTLGAFNGDDLIGYSCNVLGRNLHYCNLVTLQNAALFVRADCRHGLTGGRLILATEQAARDRGAHIMIWNAKPNTSLNAILSRPRSGYRAQDVMYTKVI